MMTTLRSVLLPVLASLAAASAAAQAPCTPDWLATFGSQPGTDRDVLATAVYDDGSGPALYVGGNFTTAGAAAANFVARWDGTSWSGVGGGLSSTFGSGAVRALAVYDDGSGPALYAGGRFETAGGGAASNIARWDGTSWTALGNGVNEVVFALAVYDDGSGPALYAGGNFTSAGGGAASRIARWDGTSWSTLGSGVSWYVAALTVFDDGSGPVLVAGGDFTSAGGVPANDVARWNGTSWSALGAGLSGTSVNALAVFNSGSGPVLYAGGNFTTALGAVGNNMARWTGSAWTGLGAGVNYIVSALRVYDDGGGPDLYVGGWFDSASGQQAERIARWSGFAWSPVGSGMNSYAVLALTVFDDGSGPVLVAGGPFTRAGGGPANHVAQWNGAGWSSLGGGGLNDEVHALTVYDDGSGPALVAGGSFTFAGTTAAEHIARWNGTSWSALGSGTNAAVDALTVYDAGGGPELIAGGHFVIAGGQIVFGIARWNGSQWLPLGAGVGGLKSNHVSSLAVYDDGSGPKLYAGGGFLTAGSVNANGIACWNGSTWSALGTGAEAAVWTLAVHDDGSGAALYAGGYFDSAGGIPASGIARWNGTAWSALGSGMGGGLSSAVGALASFDDGGGPALYVGGSFTSAGGVPASYVARWDGASWSALGSGISGGPFPSVGALATFDDGSGTALYAAGSFTDAGGQPAQNIARWDGTGWSALGSGISNPSVQALAVHDDGNGPALHAGGSFADAGGSGDSFLALWGNVPGCGAPGSVVCEPGLAGVMGCPCSNPPSGAGRGCDNSSATGGAKLEASGIARLTYDTVVLRTRDERPTATSIVLQGDGLAAGGVVFGQGVRCVAGNLKRLYTKTAVAGSITAPVGADLDVHTRSAQLGDAIAAGTQRYYGVYYRDPIVLGACPAVSTYNVTQQLALLWRP